MSSRQKTKNRANVYNDPPGYYDMNSYNPRSQSTMSQGHYNAPRDSRVVADKVRKLPVDIEEILRTEALNDADPVRYWKTLNSFRPFSVYLDFSHCNADPSRADLSQGGTYFYDFSRSAVRSNNSDKAVVTSGVIEMMSGDLKMPLYLLDQNLFYDLSEIYVYFRNLPITYNNGQFPYHFKYYPTQALQITDTTKLLLIPEQKKFSLANPHQLDEFQMVIRDKAGNIVIPYPTMKGIIFAGSPTIINSPNHGLQNGFYVTRITLISQNTPSAIQRYYPISVIDADNFSIPVDTTILQQIDSKPITFLVDNYNFELNIKMININWDEEQVFPGKK